MAKAKVTANPGESTILIERVFDAPREKVFKAMTTKEIVQKWWLGPGYDVEIEELDAREGGRWKFTQIAPGGQKFGFYGVFHEVTAPSQVIQTFEFDGLPERGHISLDKMTLEETDDGKTKMTVVSSYFNEQDRDGMIQSGMEVGMQNTYNQLDKVLADM